MFNTVGLNTVSLSDISISDGGAGSIGWGGEKVQVLDEGGATVAEYTYYDSSMGDGEANFWGDEGGDPVEVVFSPGEGFMIEMGDAGLSYTVAGQVATEDCSFTSAEGFNFTGNPFPAAISIQNISISDDSGSIGWGGEKIQILDDGGATTAEYTYYDSSMGDGETNFWGDEGGDPVTIVFAPGDGFMIEMGGDLPVTFTVPYVVE